MGGFPLDPETREWLVFAMFTLVPITLMFVSGAMRDFKDSIEAIGAATLFALSIASFACIVMLALDVTGVGEAVTSQIGGYVGIKTA